MAAEHQYFYEDEVFRINKKGNIEFGMVLENSELVSSDESDGEEGGRMKQGHIRVAWHPSGEEEVIQEKKVGLADRSLMPGDVVRRMIKGRDTQRGYCRDIKVNACVQVMGSRHVITNVSSEKLVPLEEFAVDIAVCLDSWVGGIKAVNSRLTLQCSDGSRCVVKDPDTVAGFEVFDEKRDNDCEFPHRGDYYPGQTLWGPLHGLEQATWLNCTKELKAVRSNVTKSCKTVKVMVEGVETESVAVHWQCRAYSREGAGSEKEQPKSTIEGDDLKRLRLLNVFEPCTLQVGDRNFYTLTDHDTVSTKEQWRKVQKEEMVARCATNGVAAPAPLPPGSHTNTKRRNKRAVNLRDSRPSVKQTIKSTDDTNELYNSSESISKTTPVDSNSVKSCSTDSSGVQVNSNSLDQPLPEFADQTSLTLPEKSSEPIIKISPADSNTGEWGDTTDTDDDYGTDTGSNSSTASSRTSTRSGKKIPAKVNLALHFMKKKKLRRARKKPPPLVLEPGNRLVVETLSTTSSVTVVWQDGSVESNIPSTELYPIHHLDDQEFFPGDFVYEVREENSTRVYGVIQRVDHAGRTARVQWFKTYTSPEDPQPTMLQQNEVSVYDLKDHPDFQYRPGTVVIRVANFEGEDANCTAGQVLDNYPEGKVRVWWVDGHVSMCWPQDLYKVREYDSDDGELWDDVSTEASWETESVSSWPADEGVALEEMNGSIKPKLAANIEKARVAMSKLEEIFTQNPSLQTTDVMRKLLEVYKDCRYLDKLMGTTFFHESHFQGLLERVRERGRANTAQRVGDQVRRLFCTGSPTRRSEGQEDSETHQISESSNSDSGVFNSPPPPVTVADDTLAEDSVTEDATVCNSLVCVKLCSLLLAQLVEAHAEVMRRFGSNTASGMTLSDAANTVSPAGSTGETVPPSTPPPCPSGPPPTLESPAVESSTSMELTKDGDGGFSILDTAPNSHKFKLTMFQPTDPKTFFKTVRNEIKLLRTSLPSGIWVKGFEDRMDLYSVMIRGPEKTPYEDGLFFFDFQLSADYPKAPPLCHYVSYCSDRLNPNLYEDGKVCVSLLGTWSGKGTEVWSVISNLLQVIVSIQGLILVSEPYFNEAGYEKQKGSQQGRENSRMYNEMVALKLVQSMSKLILHPPPVFRQEVFDHFNSNAHKLCNRLESWLEISEKYNDSHPLSPTTPTSFRQLHSDEITNHCNVPLPEFPLIPASKGFCLTLRKTLVTFREVLNSVGIPETS
ncbi:(E3-independent) E2 ubiquitin-conjugating enzyme UBE2O-like isoform X2 [Macrosteles quadrilineatus]|uniref:(E3-independent) E2 ubiquitin-conjugating enzyme UBE2O-like isoform X2 n=1 Tax=Macrosteles quadrilineatus TaxID=74068 RepID=UPI0023E2BDEC|nr:(E3-independent) E2 ubiquitin-conjugating enzyme UBE2O-like isoform X2 [Macrosteles quadrilineatus]